MKKTFILLAVSFSLNVPSIQAAFGMIPGEAYEGTSVVSIMKNRKFMEKDNNCLVLDDEAFKKTGLSLTGISGKVEELRLLRFFGKEGDSEFGYTLWRNDDFVGNLNVVCVENYEAPPSEQKIILPEAADSKDAPPVTEGKFDSWVKDKFQIESNIREAFADESDIPLLNKSDRAGGFINHFNADAKSLTKMSAVGVKLTAEGKPLRLGLPYPLSGDVIIVGAETEEKSGQNGRLVIARTTGLSKAAIVNNYRGEAPRCLAVVDPSFIFVGCDKGTLSGFSLVKQQEAIPTDLIFRGLPGKVAGAAVPDYRRDEVAAIANDQLFIWDVTRPANRMREYWVRAGHHLSSLNWWNAHGQTAGLLCTTLEGDSCFIDSRQKAGQCVSSYKDVKWKSDLISSTCYSQHGTILGFSNGEVVHGDIRNPDVPITIWQSPKLKSINHIFHSFNGEIVISGQGGVEVYQGRDGTFTPNLASGSGISPDTMAHAIPLPGDNAGYLVTTSTGCIIHYQNNASK